ncbi:MAG: pyrroline-5-carboxylate reductase, partial [Candidatus Omnitrophota bacterium]
MKVGIIGCGNMGSAIACGLIDKNILSAEEVLLSDKDREKVKKVTEITGSEGILSEELIKRCEIILLAVKPQDSVLLLEEIKKDIKDQVVISIMAGVKISDITNVIGREVPIVRAMPNMAAFIGQSVTGICFSAAVKDKDKIKKLFESIGDVVEVEEPQMDAVTALSGSGPAYLFYLAKAMINAGTEMGMDKDKSEKLVIDTLAGAANLLKNMGVSPEELIKKVASKGGTT